MPWNGSGRGHAAPETGADWSLLRAQRGCVQRILAAPLEAVSRGRRRLGHAGPQLAGQWLCACAPKGPPRGRRRFGGVNRLLARAKGVQMTLFEPPLGVLGLLRITAEYSQY